MSNPCLIQQVNSKSINKNIHRKARATQRKTQDKLRSRNLIDLKEIPKINEGVDSFFISLKEIDNSFITLLRWSRRCQLYKLWIISKTFLQKSGKTNELINFSFVLVIDSILSMGYVYLFIDMFCLLFLLYTWITGVRSKSTSPTITTGQNLWFCLNF